MRWPLAWRCQDNVWQVDFWFTSRANIELDGSHLVSLGKASTDEEEEVQV